MGKLLTYIKRGIKYIRTEYKQPVVKVEIVQREQSNMFNDKIYLVTGGGSGIGLSIAQKLIKEKSKVIITGRNEDKLINAQKELGKNCEYYVLDMNDINKFSTIITEIFNKYGKLNGIINNAGISLHEWDFLKVTPEGFDTQFYTNLKGAYFLTQEYIRKIIEKNDTGNVIFISSERGSMAEVIPYGLTKAAIDSLTKGLSYKYYGKGIRINSIAPGVTATDMTSINKDGDLYTNNTSGRVFLPEEIAEVVCYLLSDYSKCVSGEVICCNGGNHIKMGW